MSTPITPYYIDNFAGYNHDADEPGITSQSEGGKVIEGSSHTLWCVYDQEEIDFESVDPTITHVLLNVDGSYVDYEEIGDSDSFSQVSHLVYPTANTTTYTCYIALGYYSNDRYFPVLTFENESFTNTVTLSIPATAYMIPYVYSTLSSVGGSVSTTDGKNITGSITSMTDDGGSSYTGNFYIHVEYYVDDVVVNEYNVVTGQYSGGTSAFSITLNDQADYDTSIEVQVTNNTLRPTE